MKRREVLRRRRAGRPKASHVFRKENSFPCLTDRDQEGIGVEGTFAPSGRGRSHGRYPLLLSIISQRDNAHKFVRRLKAHSHKRAKQSNSGKIRHAEDPQRPVWFWSVMRDGGIGARGSAGMFATPNGGGDVRREAGETPALPAIRAVESATAGWSPESATTL
jgi:hypothetical protein